MTTFVFLYTVLELGLRLTESLSLNDGLASILTGRVKHGDHAKQLPVLIVPLNRNSEGTEPTASELLSLLVIQSLGLSRSVGQLHDSPGSTLRADKTVLSKPALASDTLRDGVEGGELVRDPALAKDLTCLGVALQGQDGDLVDWVQGLDVVRAGQGGDGHHPVDILTLGYVWLADAQFVGGQCACLVGAENINALEDK